MIFLELLTKRKMQSNTLLWKTIAGKVQRAGKAFKLLIAMRIVRYGIFNQRINVVYENFWEQ